jgi:predicted enzyme related to lactoylglutathione lyase
MTPRTAKTATFGLSTIGQIFVRARELERAVPFYRDTLGMPFLFQVPKMAFFQCGSTTLMLGVPDAPEFDHPGSIVYYLVPDIEAAHETLQKRGVAFLNAPHLVHRASDHELWMAFFRDPDGNTLALMSRKPRR